MENNHSRIGESELDLIEMMDEIILESNSLSIFLQMAVDLVCLGLKNPSGGVIILPNLRQETLQSAWHNPQPGWLDANGVPSTTMEELMHAVQMDLREQEKDNLLAMPIVNRKKLIGVLILVQNEFNSEEMDVLRILTRMIGQRVRHFQANAATIGRDELNALLRTYCNAVGTSEELLRAGEKIFSNMIKAYKAQAIILVTGSDGTKSFATKRVFLGPNQWQGAQKIEFSTGLLRECLDSGELTQWGNAKTNPRANNLVDRVEEVPSATLVGIPLCTAGRKFGVIGILDSGLFPLDPVDQSLALSISTILAQILYNAELSENIKHLDDELSIKKVEAANSTTALKVLFESTPFLFYIINQEYKIVTINSGRAKLAESSPHDLIGRVCHAALFQSQEICQGCLAGTTLESGKSTSRSKRNWIKDTPFDWEVNCYAIHNNKGVTIQAVISEIDVTEKRRLEAELLQNEKLVAMGQLASTVAHEINNPLAAIIANAQLLLKDTPSQNQDLVESVKLIELAGLRASHVVKNLLGLARKEEYEFAPMDINESIQDALSLLSHEFMSRPIAIRFERGQNLPPIVASRENLESIWINLLMNSIESIGTDSGSIEINTFYDEGNFYVLIRDSGIGIPDEQLGRIFEPFFTTKSHGRGTGLGLSVVKRIVHAHSGSIQVDSEIGKGTTFTVILPEMQPDAKASVNET
jgi:signal transduction histidine kinase